MAEQKKTIITDENLEIFINEFSKFKEDPSATKAILEVFINLNVPDIEFQAEDPDLKTEFQRSFTTLFNQLLAHGEEQAPLAQALMRKFVELREIIKEPEESIFPVYFQDVEANFYGLEHQVDDMQEFIRVARFLTPVRGGLKSEPVNLEKLENETIVSKVFGITPIPKKYYIVTDSSRSYVELVIPDEKNKSTTRIVGNPEKYAKYLREDAQQFLPSD